MTEREEIEAAIEEWNAGLDDGDIERMVASCHPDVMTANERQPVTVGTQAIRDKYNPRIAAAEITSGYDIEDLLFYGDTAIVSGRFYGTMKMRDTGEVKRPEGRLVLGYKRDATGAWKMFLDMDNNGPA
ncbi:nuclear transport factor 2 family protein [uncultured Tateyamaria sp.]|uniref:YybH family protein n=1 Tax=uncultured Tateyamaria sp. TaxID=455651 RepID=UPI0026110196|nr:nuclear transport factor 2 family protein [uncultured Tateyamaria sp.]